MSDVKSVSELLRMQSDEQADFLQRLASNKAKLGVCRAGMRNKESGRIVERPLKVTAVAFDAGAMPLYSMRIMGIVKAIEMGGGSWVANHPKIKNQSFKFEWECVEK